MKFLKYFFLLFALVIFFFTLSCDHSNQVEVAPQTIIQESHFVLPPLPDTVFFCDEGILMNDFDRQERLDREILVNTYYHSATILSLKRANRYFPMIEAELKKEGIPDDFKFLCLIESGLAQATSPAGAKGFWQFMPKTAEEFGLRVNKEVDERLHIQKSTRAACAYLKQAYEIVEDWSLVAASYNMGIAGVTKNLEEQEVESYFDLHLNNETSRYVFRILAMKLIFEQCEAYGFRKKDVQLYDPIETRTIEMTETTDNLMHWAKEQGSTYRMLKLLNPWILSNRLSVKDQPILIELPK